MFAGATPMKTFPSPKTYLLIGVALLLLLGLTAGLAWVNLGPFNVVVALLIAAAKALLVIFFFMHVGYSKKLIWIFSGVGFVWLGILFTLAMSDYLSRGYLHIAGK